jgi:hypothetical protein
MVFGVFVMWRKLFPYEVLIVLLGEGSTLDTRVAPLWIPDLLDCTRSGILAC